MPWAKIDDSFSDHPKTVVAGPKAIALWVAGLCYAAKNLSDGFIPAAMVKKLVDPEQVGATLDELLEALLTPPPGYEFGLWEEVDGGFLIHDYLEYNPSRESVETDRAKAKDRMSKAREKARARKESEGVRETFGRTPGEQSSVSLSPNTGTGTGTGTGEGEQGPERTPNVRPNRRELCARTRPERPVDGVLPTVFDAWSRAAPVGTVPPTTIQTQARAAASNGFELDLLAEFVEIAATNTGATAGAAGYFAKLVKNHEEAGIKTLAEYRAKEAQRSSGQQRGADRGSASGKLPDRAAFESDRYRDFTITDSGDVPTVPEESR